VTCWMEVWMMAHKRREEGKIRKRSAAKGVLAQVENLQQRNKSIARGSRRVMIKGKAKGEERNTAQKAPEV
jgi:hypothetical protein